MISPIAEMAMIETLTALCLRKAQELSSLFRLGDMSAERASSLDGSLSRIKAYYAGEEPGGYVNERGSG
jgi:hypothetical protein